MSNTTPVPLHDLRTVPLDDLYLDPNNYRFIDHDDYVLVPEDRVASDDVQRRTVEFLRGRSLDGIQDLVHSFRVNGWVPVDNIQVRTLAKSRHLVVEGNRRVAALKFLQGRYREGGYDLGKLSPKVFEAVPVVRYQGEDDAHYLVLMGLKHISGNRRWPAINQARLMRKLQEDHHLGPDEVCRAVGVSKREFNLSLRTLALVDAYRASDYGDQFRSDKFNLFREVLKSPPIKMWLNWEDGTSQARHQHNLARLFSWLSEDEGDDVDEDGEELGAGGATRLDPAITTGAQIRELAKIVQDPRALERLDATRSLSEATLASDVLLKDRVRASLDGIERHIGVLFNLSGQIGRSEVDEAEGFAARLQALRFMHDPLNLPQVSQARWERPPFQTARRAHFQSIEVQRYRGLGGCALSDLRRINLVVGTNNAGKTSMLEVVFLLTQLAAPDELFNLLRRRGRMSAADQGWVAKQLPEEIAVSGVFDDTPNNQVTLSTSLSRDGEDGPQPGSYLLSMRMDGRYLGEHQWAETLLFHDRPPRIQRQGFRVLCPVVFSSPFSGHDPDELRQLWERGLERGVVEELVTFLRQYVDNGLDHIDLANEWGRFLVSHRDLDTPLDLSSFGEGFQRIFHVGLLFAFARGGVALIDEFENALHVGVLHEFTRFVEQLADRFDVQVFATTHSKECIDAFLLNEERVDNLAIYGMVRNRREVEVRRVDGERARRLVELTDADFRRVS